MSYSSRVLSILFILLGLYSSFLGCLTSICELIIAVKCGIQELLMGFDRELCARIDQREVAAVLLFPSVAFASSLLLESVLLFLTYLGLASDGTFLELERLHLLELLFLKETQIEESYGIGDQIFLHFKIKR